MARFDGHDGSSRSQDARVLDEVCSTKVRSDTDVLHELGDRHHGCDIPEHTRKIELASRQRRLAKADDEFLEGGNMDGLVDLDDRDLGDGDVGGEETSIEEVGRLEFFQRLRVELCLEVLEDISKVFSYKKKSVSHIASRTEKLQTHSGLASWKSQWYVEAAWPTRRVAQGEQQPRDIM